ncbi:MAG: M20/M25/M40 family metallo-hydrolase, partial [Gammaproteobacteria bacterium]|nr:M20/M25/M40 family metallo-hydrolase [Gammaproteobacteria bacterium]
NLRYSTEQTAEQIQSRVEALAKKHDQNAKIEWKLNGEPFLTQAQELIQSTISAINKVTNITAKPETSGGTSDGRFIAKTGAQIVELGPVNQTIHQINECILVEDLERLSEIYYNILCQML